MSPMYDLLAITSDGVVFALKIQESVGEDGDRKLQPFGGGKRLADARVVIKATPAPSAGNWTEKTMNIRRS